MLLSHESNCLYMHYTLGLVVFLISALQQRIRMCGHFILYLLLVLQIVGSTACQFL